MLSPQNPFGAVRIENDTTAERSLVAVFWTLVLGRRDRYALKSRSPFDGEKHLQSTSHGAPALYYLSWRSIFRHSEASGFLDFF